MANNVTTEWEDIHVKLGNYLPREKEKSNDELQKIAIESIQNYDPLEHKTLDQLKKMEEEDDDDEVIKAYVVNKDMKELSLKLGDLTDDERDIILAGCLINYYKTH